MTDKKATKEINSWAMACSLLIGTRQAIAKANAEHAAIVAETQGNTFLSGASTIADTAAVLRDIERSLDWELSRIARSSNLPMPTKCPEKVQQS